MNKNDTLLAVMFADIAGSTSLYERLGDVEARNIVSKCINMICDVVIVNSGYVVKTIGDEVMCAFADIEDAAHTSLVLLDMALHSNSPLSLRVGFNYGPVIVDADTKDIFGDTVNVAARMASQAKHQQIITTKETINQLPLDLRKKSRYVANTKVKGKSRTIEIYELIWGNTEDVTVQSAPEEKYKQPIEERNRIRLKVCYDVKVLYVDEHNRELTLGRDSKNTLAIDNSMISRNHATIEYRDASIFFTDKSTNGSIVISGTDKNKAFVHRDDIELKLDGSIILGNKLADDKTNHIIYFVESNELTSSNIAVISDSSKRRGALELLLELNGFELVTFFNVKENKLEDITNCSANAIFVDLDGDVDDEVWLGLDSILEKTALPVLFSEDTIGSQKKDDKYYRRVIKQLRKCCAK